ncbi:6-phosphogluconolactonase [Helicobacter mustelae]|uniref:6-phosphogluconolactonase n=1 Tax=Helicobacter mustelae (strain ATCC 43772 / CCUG 25715 / CIP 103759 / LMG 18044 / NCTC 12198 / R85-136P) TaxID=679897 RepID=D3UGY6_HELM1|nr:6-phosphogluconolactonase [Helicobacter mustelae]CBG39758.1 6-phosphogluconolactonase [Helicobacter mustelae 12198]SQH71267.1 6-phosphogluconolactonase [Helicobacter mustelae]STP12392.1 6-phosphogluconolactonase [Helicobacter mustelae]
MAFRFYEFSNSQECNLSLVSWLGEFLTEKALLNGGASLAVSGGKSPVALFELLSREKIAWDKICISLVDERIVSLESEDSNTALVKSHLLQNSAKGASFIPILKDPSLSLELLLEFANKHYRQADLAILGMGLDGHTASLFPEASEFEHALESEQNIISTTPKNAPYQRLSMSLKALKKTKKLILTLKGEDKKKVFEEASLGVNPKLPISYILHSREVDCDVYYSK